MKKHFTRLLVVSFSLILLSACSSKTALKDITNSGELTALDEISYDWGNINIQGGNVEHVFPFKNGGEDDLILKGAQTSCMCTTARYRFSDNTISPKYGMHAPDSSWVRAVKPGETFDVEVVFDPMAHGPNATGPIQRTVTLFSSDQSPLTELQTSGMVLSEKDYLNRNLP